MQLITKGKTNWKYILIVLISAFIIGGGVLAYLYLRMPKEESISPVKSCPDLSHIDCMPIVDPSVAKYCYPENRKWIQEHCPNILFTD